MSTQTSLNYKGLKCAGAVVDPPLKKVVKRWTFDPASDITLQEFCILLPYLLTSGSPGLLLDDLTFFYERNLQRHFTFKEVSPVIQAVMSVDAPSSQKT